MFVDIRSFTAGSAHLSPTKAVGFLNEFLRAMVEAVEGEHRGMINKFLGDGFMALFDIGGNDRNHSDKALAAALIDSAHNGTILRAAATTGKGRRLTSGNFYACKRLTAAATTPIIKIVAHSIAARTPTTSHAGL